MTVVEALIVATPEPVELITKVQVPLPPVVQVPLEGPAGPVTAKVTTVPLDGPSPLPESTRTVAVSVCGLPTSGLPTSLVALPGVRVIVAPMVR